MKMANLLKFTFIFQHKTGSLGVTWHIYLSLYILLCNDFLPFYGQVIFIWMFDRFSVCSVWIFFFASLSYKFMQTTVYGKNLMCESVHGCLNIN